MSHSKKRSAEGEQGRRGELAETNELDELEFEDPYGDDIEEDEEDEEIVDGEEQEGDAEASEPAASTGPPQVVKQVWRSGVQKLEDIEELEYDPSAYIMYHSMQTEWPCLSFDFLKDDLGDTRHRVSCFPCLQCFGSIFVTSVFLRGSSFPSPCSWSLDPKLTARTRTRLPFLKFPT